jgi:RNA polymerase sigma-70 factor, ECF subfamily
LRRAKILEIWPQDITYCNIYRIGKVLIYKMEKTDEQLIKQYLRGDEKSLEFLVKRYLKSIYGFIYRRTGNFQDAEDTAQEVFLRAWRNLKSFNSEKSFKAWIFSIAKNACIDFLRKKKALVYLETQKEIGKNDKNLQQIENIQFLSSVTKRLIPEYQTVLSFYYNRDLNFREISEKTGESINTIKSRYRRAVLELRKNISDY